VESFWYAAFQQAKHLRRGDLWVAKLRDRELKDALLRMLAWHAGAAHGWQLDTWHDGRFMHEWVSERTWLAEAPEASPRALAQAERAISETLEHHGGVRLRSVAPRG
jgi:hypothetical protein